MTFTASNGARIETRFDGAIKALKVEGNETCGIGLCAADANALREYFQHERDERLGLWRWPENPVYVVKETTPPGAVMVCNEHTLVSFMPDEKEARESRSEWARAARAYFDAHPIQRPILVQVETIEGAWVTANRYAPGNEAQYQSARNVIAAIGRHVQARIVREGDDDEPA